MSLPDRRSVIRLLLAGAAAVPLAACFQPLYADRHDGTPSLHDKLMGIEVPPLQVPNASRIARLGVEIRNALMFKLYGGPTGAPPTHRLEMRLATSGSAVILDAATALPDIENYGIDASYTLKDVATNKVVLTGTTFARVSYDIPGQTQRFARSRAYRDAEDRACQQIAENIKTRLASYFYAGT